MSILYKPETWLILEPFERALKNPSPSLVQDGLGQRPKPRLDAFKIT